MPDRTIISFDYAIKHILRDKSNFNILSGFLTELLGRKVTVLSILECEGNKNDPTAKTNRVDLKAEIDGGEIAIFEIQFADQYDFFGKMLFNVSKAVVEHVSKGEDYHVKKIYMVSIAYFDIGAKRDYMFTAKIGGFKGVHSNESIPFAQNSYLQPSSVPKTDIHPEYYLILPKMFGEQVKSGVDEWVYALKTSVVKGEFKAAGIQEAGKKLNELKMTPQERRAYERYLMDMHDSDAQMKTAIMKGMTRGMEKGRREGVAQGRKEGVAIGRKEGVVQGRKEGVALGRKEGVAQGRKEGEAAGLKKGEAKLRKTALAMKKDGIDPKTVAKWTGLTVAEIRKL
jgi:predicted transposase/invertase (TIGR01784 family)